jgi:hypothetical protein
MRLYICPWSNTFIKYTQKREAIFKENKKLILSAKTDEEIGLKMFLFVPLE